MEFEDFSAAPAAPQSVAEPGRGVHDVPAPERFLAIYRAIQAATNGDYGSTLAISGSDRLTALAGNVNRLLENLRHSSTAQGGGAASISTSTAYDQLLKANSRLEYLIANTPAIIYSSVPTGDFKMNFVSANAFRVLGYHPEEMVADPNFWFEHIHPDDVPAIFSSLALVFSQGRRTYEYRFRASDGQYLWMHDSLRLIRDDAGAPLEVVGSLTDITMRKTMEDALQKKGDEQRTLIDKLQRTQAQLLQSEKMASIGQLAAGVAHEINNPVGFVNSNMGALNRYVDTLFKVIDGYDRIFSECQDVQQAAKDAEALKQQADLEFLREDVVQLVGESLDGLTRVKEIVQSLKDFSHVGETEWQFADIHQGLDSTLTIANNEIKYTADVVRKYGELPLVNCLVSQLNQVFMNLVVNASHAIRNRGTVTIRTGCVDAWIWIEIEDTGEGIAPENLSRIFEPFFTTKPVGKGTGLGLSLSYNIISKHNGRIEVSSEVGKGTCFTIHLPVDGKGT